ncbi:MAG: aldose 1-epimerase [Jiangellaceae bacterium]
MAPWAGRIRRGRFTHAGVPYDLPTDVRPPHAIHGMVLTRRWSTVEATATTAVLECRLGDPWPWPGRVRHTVTLGDGRADFSLQMHTDTVPFPASAGWHPWFRRRLSRGEPVQIGLDAAAMLPRDADGIPAGDRVAVGAGPWDDCFDGVRWPVTLTWPGTLRLEIAADTRYAVVYDELAEAVCVEPQTGPPDALNLEPAVVSPGRPLTATMTWTWRSPEPPVR